MSQKTKFSQEIDIYDYDKRLERTHKLLKRDLSTKNYNFIKKYDQYLTREARAKAYKLKTKTEPIEDELCPKCNKKIRTKYIGITKLHKWVLKEKIVNEKLESVGYLTANLGAGGAHPPLHVFPRDPELAKLAIQTTIVLLKEIYSKIKP